ncbi:DUF5681 domain-containing protein [Legionella feeleii]|uniref:DUF5681 domain-containing protein n=1 Tax=Legionella feeleii TaxID=453 RepID=A0A378IT87_9GAMM|nr:DUF5681 domain-containing protein [Legionella feeleii]STX37711.1 Uncharacterised protein [Legionella feeleii]
MSKFKKGQSGNPGGKKPGTINKRTQLGKLLEPYAEDLVIKAVELALAGDVHAIKICLDRLIPKATNLPVQFEMNGIDIDSLDNLSIIGKRIMTLIASGNITPEDGQRVIGVLDAQRKFIEHVDIVRKLDELSEHFTK